MITIQDLQNELLKHFKEVTFTEKDHDDNSKTIVYSLREKLNGKLNNEMATYYHGLKLTKEEFEKLELEEMVERIRYMYGRVMIDAKYEQIEKESKTKTKQDNDNRNDKFELDKVEGTNFSRIRNTQNEEQNNSTEDKT